MNNYSKLLNNYKVLNSATKSVFGLYSAKKLCIANNLDPMNKDSVSGLIFAEIVANRVQTLRDLKRANK